MALGVVGEAAGQNPTPEELSRAFTEKFLGVGAGSTPSLLPSPSPAPGVVPTDPGTLFSVPATPVAPAVSPANPVGPPPQFVLAGVVMVGETGMALLQEPGQPGSRFVQVGESVGAYRLAAVRPDRAILAGPGGEIAVLLGGATSAGPSRGGSPTQRANPVPVPPGPTVTPPAAQGGPRSAERDARRGRQITPAPQPGPSEPAGAGKP